MSAKVRHGKLRKFDFQSVISRERLIRNKNPLANRLFPPFFTQCPIFNKIGDLTAVTICRFGVVDPKIYYPARVGGTKGLHLLLPRTAELPCRAGHLAAKTAITPHGAQQALPHSRASLLESSPHVFSSP